MTRHLGNSCSENSGIFTKSVNGGIRTGLLIAGLAVGLALSACGEKSTTSSDVSGTEATRTEARLSPAQLATGRGVLADNCSACHAEDENGHFSRISDMRKTPEGWDMTIVRMMNFHGLEITSEDRATLVRYLADTQGLAPSETADFRYILERVPNYQESGHDPDLMKMCARCHTYARVALQRRDADEWKLLAHMHLGQWPSTEYQLHARDREWWVDATHEVPKKLGEMYPLSTPAWTAWKDKGDPVMDGKWRVVGKWPGHGTYEGIATITPVGDGTYKVEYDTVTNSGQKATASSHMQIFTGYEWRAQGKIGDQDMQEVYTISEDGNSFQGRWFLDPHDEIGGYDKGVRIDGAAPQILSVVPGRLKAGEETEVTINGVGLNGKVDLGPGVSVTNVSADGQKVVVRAMAATDAATGLRTVKVGGIEGEQIAVYDKVDSVRVTPGYAVARVGGNGGTMPRVKAQFEAIGYLNGPDGKAGTDDDVPLGPMKAEWTTLPYDATAAAMQDAKYAGTFDDHGTFTPGAAGPNPDRRYDAGNSGDLKVVATVRDGETELKGQGHLIVTVQRWNLPPIH